MLLRPRPDGAAAAARIAALLPQPRGGWVPPEDDADGEVAPEDERDVVPEGGPTEPTDQERSWAAGGRHRALDTPRCRLDPGRRGAIGLVLLALVAAVAAGGVLHRGRPQEVPVPLVEAAGVPLPGTSAAAVPPSAEVVVAVAGKVVRPGLVRLPTGSRVDDAVRAAGGPLPGSGTGMLNLARRLVDGEQVLVGVDPPPGTAPAGGGAAGGLLDLNAATVSDLDALPGIGPVLAQRIVDWRTENGRFASVDQLREVTGIGEAKFEDVRSKVVV